MTTPATTVPAARSGRRGRRRLAVLGVTALAGLLTWAVLDLLLSVELSAQTGPTVRTVGAGAVVVAAVLAAAAGWLTLAVLERVTTHARRAWTLLAGIVLVVSLVGALGGVTAAAIGGLMTLHLVVGLTIILGLRGGPRD